MFTRFAAQRAKRQDGDFGRERFFVFDFFFDSKSSFATMRPPCSTSASKVSKSFGASASDLPSA